MDIRILQHVDFEGPAYLEEWAVARGHRLKITRADADPLPEPDTTGLLIVLGGPMSVHDEALLPWLTREKRCLEAMLKRDRPILGICLGAQLLADVLGARVYRNPVREIGWYPVEQAEGPPFAGWPPRFDAFHWHGETFELPLGAVNLARSKACENQAFLWSGHVLALQFHLEATPASIRELVRHCGDELAGGGPWIQDPEAMVADPGRFTAAHRLLDLVLDRWAAAGGRDS
jgi:GMP synthase-like glutamine amidotransferase